MKYNANKRRNKAKDLFEIEKPRGFDRGLELKKIIGAANLGKTPATLKFLVQWEGCDELDLMEAPEMNEKAPEEIIAYYENLSSINKRFEEKEKQRLTLALRPVIVSKVEQMMHNESVSNEDLFRVAVQEATTEEVPVSEPVAPETFDQAPAPPPQDEAAAMVEIPQEYQQPPTDMPLIQEDDMGWVAEEQTI